jgi:hypothetical protein
MVTDSIEKRVKELTPDLDLVYGFVKVFHGSRDMEWCLWNKPKVQEREIADHAILFRRRVFQEYGLFDESLIVNVDAEMWYRIGIMERGGKRRKTPLKYRKVPVLCAYVRIHKGSTAHMISKKKKHKNRERLRNRIVQLNREGITRENTIFP